LLGWLRYCRLIRQKGWANPLIKLAPTGGLSKTIVELLEFSELLVRAEPSRTGVSQIGSAVRACSPDDWQLGVALRTNEEDLVSTAKLFLMAFSPTDSDLDEVGELWRMLIISECISYLDAKLREHGLDLTFSALAEPIIARMLEVMPALEVFRWCSVAVRDLTFSRSTGHQKGVPESLRLVEFLERGVKLEYSRGQQQNFHPPRSVRVFGRGQLRR